MIEISNLKYKYAGAKQYVFNNFSLSLSENNIYGLLGKNGMGKSTLLYLISGLLRKEQGTITIDGIETDRHDPAVLSEIFLVPEEFELMPMSLDAYVKMNEPFYPHFSREVLKSCLNDFELTPDINLKELSMGQKKKVYMSFALAANTKLLLMDEPSNGLDIPSKSQFRKVVANNMSDDRTMIISTHQVHDVESLLDHIMILDHSELLLNESVADICSKYSFEFRSLGEPADDVIYAEPSLQGNAVITRRRDNDEETQLNLELLFNAVTKKLLPRE
ncbi:ABC transporter ATP-binding protein [Prevotella sp.]|uniref:ABC transporter ATP-binding protein n=1 Tax=Prevotella sp. TaxID=59823 RepID=UPI003AB75173